MVVRGKDIICSAVWTESGILRLENRKIVEMWVVEDQFSQWRQFEFWKIEPEV